MSGHGNGDPESLPAFLLLNLLPAGSGAREGRAVELSLALPHPWGAKAPQRHGLAQAEGPHPA